MASSSCASLPRLLTRARMHERMRTRLGRSPARGRTFLCTPVHSAVAFGGGVPYVRSCMPRALLSRRRCAHGKSDFVSAGGSKGQLGETSAQLGRDPLACKGAGLSGMTAPAPNQRAQNTNQTQARARANARTHATVAQRGTPMGTYGTSFAPTSRRLRTTVCASCALGQANFSTHADAHNTATPKFVPAPEACWGPYACPPGTVGVRRCRHARAALLSQPRLSPKTKQSTRMWRRATEQRRVSERFA